jgi:hypothetical protein
MTGRVRRWLTAAASDDAYGARATRQALVVPRSASERVQMSSTRKIAVVAGAFASVAAVAAIARLVLFQPVVKHPGYLLGPGAAARVTLGASFEVILAIAATGTAVTRYPIVKWQDRRDLPAAASEAGPVPAGSRPAPRGPGPRGAPDCAGAAAPPASRPVAGKGTTTTARPRIRAPLLAAACAPVSDFTGAMHGYDSGTIASGSPTPPRPGAAARQA